MLFSTDMAQLAFVSRKAAAFAASHDLAGLENGRHDLGDGDFVNVMEYTTKDRPAACYEAHRDYVDVQAVLRGAELIEVAPTGELEETQAYDEADDYALFSGAHAGERFLMRPGRFCLVMPEDAHMPGLAVDQPAPVKKAVFKIRVDHLEAAGR